MSDDTSRQFTSGRTGVLGGSRLFHQLTDDRDRARPAPSLGEQGANMSQAHQELEATEYFATCGGTLIRIAVPIRVLTRTSDGRVLTSWLI